MKQLFSKALGILMLLGVVSLYSCSNEDEVGVMKDVDKAKTEQLVFSFQTPAGAPVIYTRAIHDQPEYTLKSLWMYEFNASNNEFISKKNIKGDLKTTSDPTVHTYTHSIEVGDKSSRRYIFVANEDEQTAANIAELEEKLAKAKLEGTTGTLKEGENLLYNEAIPMTGVAMQGNSPIIAVTGTVNTPIKVALTRIVARIDVKNAVPNLVITGLKLINTNSQSYILPKMENEQPTYAAPETSEKVELGTYAELPSPFNYGAPGEYKELKKAFYLYEGVQPADEKEATHIVVKGQLGGKNVVYQIPFKKDNALIPVKRNHIYRLTLGDDKPLEPGTDVGFTIEDIPWNEVLVNEIYNPLRLIYSGTALEGRTWDALNLVMTANGKRRPIIEITEKNSPEDRFYWILETEFKEHTQFVANKVESTENTDWLTIKLQDFDGKTYLHTGVTGLTGSGAVRKAQVEIYSDADPTTKQILTIIQDVDKFSK